MSAKSRVSRARGFTLVELMVALTGGLFISIFVFMVARQGSHFYQQETRISNATIGVLNGFQRLRTDIARAGFLASPNRRNDPRACTAAGEGFDQAPLLRTMGGIFLEVGGSTEEPAKQELADFWTANELNPDRITIAGSFGSADQFPAAEITRVDPTSNIWTIYLQPNSPAMARLGYDPNGDDDVQIALLKSVFMPDDVGRALRIQDKKGFHHYGVVGDVGLATVSKRPAPYIELTGNVTLAEAGQSTRCGLQGLNVGALVNVVNFVRYELRRLDTETFAALYDTTDDDELTRAELVREELNVLTGEPIPSTTELVAEYAVDLKFGFTILNTEGNGKLETVAEGDDALVSYGGDPSSGALPQRIRTVHARLAVRSRAGDRESNIEASEDIPEGLYRVALGPDCTSPFARVRTLQADIALRNHLGANW